MRRKKVGAAVTKRQRKLKEIKKDPGSRAKGTKSVRRLEET
jgi:hypothetical protein